MTLKKQILIVEDNEINRDMLAMILSDQYTVIETKNGSEALDVLAVHKNDIALILLDVMMPVMDGYTFLKRIKDDSELASIPVIVTTQNDSEEDELEALEHGATDFVPKPYRPQIILHRVASLINLRENAAMVNQLQYDRLTGLYSKEFFYKRVREQMQAHPKHQYTLVCSNVENFKLYNDVLGVPAGNDLLKEIAGMFLNLSDKNKICGRYSADRFMLLKRRDSSPDYNQYVEAGQKMFCKVENVVIKWGIYEVKDITVPVEHMCDRAFLAADSIKNQYNTLFAVYDDGLRDKLLREQTIKKSMETALSEKQFRIYLQPKFNLSDNRLAGAEALVRWIHPQMGFLSPDEFIPLFEKNGFIAQMDKYVWEQVCFLLHDWKARGLATVPVSVNISRSDIYQIDIVETLVDMVRRYELEPAMLHLEITESAYTEKPEQLISAINRLQKLGFFIEMDDFGKGYSSLNMLNRINLNILKLDMQFIQSETAKPTEHSVMRFVVEMAHRMNLSTVAEGIETSEQLERIREIGCDYAQGYFFAKPMPCTNFEKYLTEQSLKY